MREKVIFQNSKGDDLVGILSCPSEEKSSHVAVLCHGFSSSKKSIKHQWFEKDLNKKGVATFRFDFYGHGESDGEFENITVSEAIDDARQAIGCLKMRGYKSVSLVGSSFGGLVSLVVASQYPELFSLVLIAPVSNYREKIEHGFINSCEGLDDLEEKGYCYYLGGVWGKLKLKKLKLAKTFFDDAFQYDGYQIAKDIKIRTLIIHGDKDNTVSVDQSKITAKAISGSKLMIINGANHVFLNPVHFLRMVKNSVDFITKQVKRDF